MPSMLSIGRLLIFFTLTCFSQLAYAQISQLGSPGIVNYQRTHYQAGTQNWAIGQDSSGLLYFGNNKGLLEYDGSDWRLYALPNRTILRSFAIGVNGKIYAGGQSEFGYFSPGMGGQLVYHSLVSLIPSDLRAFEDVWKVLMQGEALFFCSERAIFKYLNDTIEVINPRGGRFENFFELDQTLYFQDRSQGLYSYKDGVLQAVVNSDDLMNERIVSILPSNKARALIVTADQGIFELGNDGLKRWSNPLNLFAIENQAYCAISLSDGGIALGTALNGLVVSNRAGDILMELNSFTGLENNTVLSIFEDAQQNLWMGLDNGIAYAEINSPFSYIGPESGIEGTGYAAALFGDKLYLGTNQGLYSAPWPAGKRGSLKFSPVNNGVGQVWSINELSSAGAIVSQHKGAAILNDNALIKFSPIQGAWKFVELARHPGFALEGTYTGLVLYRKDASSVGGWRMVKKLDGFYESSRVFEEDNEGYIWVSHAYKGLFKIRLSENLEAIEQITSYGPEQGLPEPLFINVAKIHNDLVFTTPAGIYRYNRLADRFEEHSDFSEIFGSNRNVHRLLEDGHGNIWFSIEDEFGILKLDASGTFKSREVAYFNQLQEGLVDGFELVYAADKGNVFIGTEKGFIHFDPTMEVTADFPFGIIIRRVTSITETDSTVHWGGRQVDAQSIPEYHHKLNDFRFDFTAPYFEQNSHLLYRFRLEGFDKDWSEWTTRTDKEYTNLSHGTYTFAVQARNAYAVLSDEASFCFRVLPPWWATLYAKVAYVIISILALLAFIAFVRKREKRKTEAFKLEQQQNLHRKEALFKKEVEKSEAELISLRNEKLKADVSHKTSQLASATMHLVQKTEMLMKLKNDLTKLSGESTADLKRKILQITRAIDSDIQLDNNWEQFEIYFDQVHENFFKRLRQKHPELTPKDQKLCAYLRMNLSTKEIAPLLNISVRGVEISRYRVRKKLGLESDTNLVEFIMDV